MNETDLAWAAGMFEGEGSVRINAPTHRNLGSLLVDMASTDEEIVRFFADEWGGTVKYHPAVGRKQGHWRWRAAANQADRLLADILPYLRVQRVRTKVLLAREYQEQKRGRSGRYRGEAYRQRQVAYYELMKKLNARGTGARPRQQSMC